MHNLQKESRLYFCGIGGSGMSALAQLCVDRGYIVSGSDRRCSEADNGGGTFQMLNDLGVTLYPQDGSGVTDDLDAMIVSTAIEDTVPDMVQAKALGIPVIHRATLLSSLLNESEHSVAVAGTSGKSTVTGMTGWLFHAAGRQPTIVNGAVMKNFHTDDCLGNIVSGKGGHFIAEVDESDGSFVRFFPSVGVINNITLDHKPLEELRPLFCEFMGNVKDNLLINADDPEAVALVEACADSIGAAIEFFALKDKNARFQAHDIEDRRAQGMGFSFVDAKTGQTVPVNLPQRGVHNIYNAMAALSVAVVSGLDMAACADALSHYQGLERRFDVVGISNNISVIDDFAHNPDKIAASLKTLANEPGKLWVVFQPHGFGPTRLLRDDLIASFCEHMRSNDVLIMPPIYYAGGTAAKDISSGDIIAGVTAGGRQGHYLQTRKEISNFIAKDAQAGDIVIVMGARDPSLSTFAKDIFTALATRT